MLRPVWGRHVEERSHTIHGHDCRRADQKNDMSFPGRSHSSGNSLSFLFFFTNSYAFGPGKHSVNRFGDQSRFNIAADGMHTPRP